MKVREDQIADFRKLLAQYKPHAKSSAADYLQHITDALKKVHISVVALYIQASNGTELPTIRFNGTNRGYEIVIMENSDLDYICQLLLAAVILHCEMAAVDDYAKYSSSNVLFACEPAVEIHYQKLLCLAKKHTV